VKLKVLLPTGVLVDEEVTKVTLEASDGEMTLLPGHIDMTAPVVPGVLSYVAGGNEQFVAVADGILVVLGDEVLVSVRKGVRGPALGRLRERIDEEFRWRDEHEQQARTALNKMEATFVHRFIELGHE
jgi:F-type H+-transporting ATPase subunit epsilon